MKCQSHFTAACRQRLVERFGRTPSTLSRQELRQYVEELEARGLSASRVVTHLSAIRFLYCRTLGRPDMVSFISLPRVRSPLPQVLSCNEVQALLNAIRVPEYQALAMVMYGAGLRIQEALDLEVDDIDRERGVIHVRHGKGNKPREAKLSPALYSWLRLYWSYTHPAAPYLFVSKRTGKPFKARTMRTALAKAAQAAGLKKRVTPHVLRHSFASHLLEQGTDINVVRALLGHESLRSTLRYARVTRKLVRQAPSPLDLLPQRDR